MNEEIDEEKFNELLEGFSKLKFKKRKNPTFLEIIKQPTRETLWTNFLAFYFNPNKEHKLGDLMLRSFFDALRKTVEIKNLNNIEVHPDFRTQKGNKIDLVVIADNFVIAIENKVYHFLNNPLDDYGNEIEKKAIAPECQSFKVILSIDHYYGVKGFVNLTYECLINSIEKNLREYKGNPKSKYLTFFKDFLRNIKNTIKFKAMIENKKSLEYFRSKYDEISKLSSKFGEIKDEVDQKFREIHEAVDLSELDNSFKNEFGGNVNIDKAGIEYCNGGLTFWIFINTEKGHIVFECAIYGLDVYCYADSKIESYQIRIAESEKFELEIDISEETKDAAHNIVEQIEKIINTVFKD